ncbi:MAG: hypothetical protein KF696_14025 [Planctomycetes bacterium]|nr:hypothetical protein [Planctomycetota bacterium]MCW8136887.1 hypothetical protein [Planctomycetota bacterium]
MRKFASLWLWAVVAILGAAAGPIAAQCSGCGCGGGSSSGAGSGGGGSCPTGGCGGGGKSVSKVDRPNGATSNGSGQRRAAGPAVSPEELPAWNKASTEALESAAREKRPIVVLFPDENDNDGAFAGKELAELSKTSALFVRMPYTADREKSPWAEESAVPTSKLLSDNPARDFNVPVGKATVLVLDWHGNEHNRLTTSVKANELQKHVEKVADKVKDINDKLEKTLAKAKDAHEKANRKEALKQIMSNFKGGIVGVPAQEETIRLYRAIMDEVRAEMAKLVESKDTAGLKTLQKDMRKTDVEKEINEAVKNLG